MEFTELASIKILDIQNDLMKIGKTEFRSPVLQNCKSDAEHFKASYCACTDLLTVCLMTDCQKP